VTDKALRGELIKGREARVLKKRGQIVPLGEEDERPLCQTDLVFQGFLGEKGEKGQMITGRGTRSPVANRVRALWWKRGILRNKRDTIQRKPKGLLEGGVQHRMFITKNKTTCIIRKIHNLYGVLHFIHGKVDEEDRNK